MITFGVALYGVLTLTTIVGLARASARPLPDFEADTRHQDNFMTDTAQAL
jgi:hypothetical protein